jgi:hypothetical protein
MKVEATKMERLNKVPLHRAPRKIPLKLQDVSGHDFSRAKRATKSHWASAPFGFLFSAIWNTAAVEAGIRTGHLRHDQGRALTQSMP